MSKPKIYMTMLGAAGDEVTGSSTLLKIVYDKRTSYGLIDAGIVQGKSEIRNFSYPVLAENLDFVILTHAHADHFLALPLLRNFKGKIYATTSTFNQGRELLSDAALNYERNAAGSLGISFDAYRAMRSKLDELERRKNHQDLVLYNQLWTEISEIEECALYTLQDVENITRYFVSVPVYQDFILAHGVYARLIPATHQNGAVNVELYVGGFDEDSVNIAFSGDIGSKESLLYKKHNYKENPLINYIVMESLHGLEERTQTYEDAFFELKKIIFDAQKRKKTLILAGFALDRSAMLLYAINKMIDDYGLSATVYFDSPLAHRELKHYEADYATGKSHWFKDLGRAPFDTNEVIVTDRYEAHMDAVRDQDPKIIITASAFGDGGRILDYFDRYIQDDNAMFVFVSWLSEDCSSYVLHNAERGKIIELHGMHYVKRCETYQVQGFSAHGYLPEFIEFIERFPKIKGIFLNHANRDVKKELRDRLAEDYNMDMYIPEMYDETDSNFYCITAEGVKELLTYDGYEVFKNVMNINQ